VQEQAKLGDRCRWRHRVAANTRRAIEEERAVGDQRVDAPLGAGGCHDQLTVSGVLVARAMLVDGFAGGLPVLGRGPYPDQRPVGVGGPMDPRLVVASGLTRPPEIRTGWFPNEPLGTVAGWKQPNNLSGLSFLLRAEVNRLALPAVVDLPSRGPGLFQPCCFVS
jgi:hypothetical protein